MCLRYGGRRRGYKDKTCNTEDMGLGKQRIWDRSRAEGAGDIGTQTLYTRAQDIRDTKLRRQYMERHKTLDMEVQRHNIKMQDKRTLDIDRGQNKGHGDLVT